MTKSHFFAETKNGEIKEFYTVTFLLDNTLYAWTDHKIIEDIVINNIDANSVKPNVFIRTKENWYSYRPNGYTPTGSSKPTENDIPMYSLRNLWIEKW